MPPEWTAVLETVRSIQPPPLNPDFVQFFFIAKNLATADPVPIRHVQRVPLGALVLKVPIESCCGSLPVDFECCRKGMDQVFQCMGDRVDGDVVFERLGTMWDELISLNY